MSNLYTTKSLGRTWLPPPSTPTRGSLLNNRSLDYFSARSSPMLESQPFRWSSREKVSTPGSWSHRSWWKWSKIHERILLLASFLVLVTWWCWPRDGSVWRRGTLHLDAYLHWTQGDAEVELEMRNVTWRDFAYLTFATQVEDLCSSVMMVEALHRLGAKAERAILYSTDLEGAEARLLRKAREKYGAVLQPVTGETEMLAFNQTQYQRILVPDSDSTILRPMDELFLLPSTPVAMPRAYWKENALFDALTLITPSTTLYELIQNARAESEESNADLLSRVFGSSIMVFPHRDYALVTQEFRKEDHAAYLGQQTEAWDAEKGVEDAKFVLFNDVKPWEPISQEEMEGMRPKCKQEGSMEEDCKDREVWERLYRDFRERRKAICGTEFAGLETENDQEGARLLADPNQSVIDGDDREAA